MSHVRSSTPVAVCLALTVANCLGCQSWNSESGILGWRGNGYDERVNALTEDLRPPGDERRFTGVDNRARDIERSLGVR